MIKTVTGQYLELRYVEISRLQNMGLCNQLYTLVAAILICQQQKVPLLFVGPFHLEVNSKFYAGIGRILDLDAINNYIRPKYKVGVFDVKTYSYKYTASYFKNPKKELALYSINQSIVECVKLINTKEGNDILNNLYFQKNLVDVPMKFINENKVDFDMSKLQVIHLRNEYDALVHWSQLNKMTVNEFYCKLCEKYIMLMERHINKEDPLIFITGRVDSQVFEHAKNKNYKFIYFTKTSKYREINALMDLILGKMCAKVFIGAGGSTFSDMIHTSFKFDDRVKSYFVNLDNIIS